jgi:hypothetical protein
MGEDTTIAGSDAFTIPVPSALPADTTTAMQPLMPLVPFPYTWDQWIAASALVLALLALGLWGYMRYRRWGDAEDAASHGHTTTAYEATCTQLSRLSPPGANAEAKAFYTALTQALRTYLAKRLGMPARERTSAEVVHALQQHPQVPKQAAGRIQAVLELADLAKFADTSPDTAANRTALQETKQAVDAIEHALSPPTKPRASATLHDANAPRADHRTPDAASE